DGMVPPLHGTAPDSDGPGECVEQVACRDDEALRDPPVRVGDDAAGVGGGVTVDGSESVEVGLGTSGAMLSSGQQVEDGEGFDG
ncbi:MAG: hypothetical protein L0K01_08925, partial [Brachybacterium sp.]|nr:hypothetical protein [Brachybacterium sp.]